MVCVRCREKEEKSSSKVRLADGAPRARHWERQNGRFHRSAETKGARDRQSIEFALPFERRMNQPGDGNSSLDGEKGESEREIGTSSERFTILRQIREN